MKSSDVSFDLCDPSKAALQPAHTSSHQEISGSGDWASTGYHSKQIHHEIHVVAWSSILFMFKKRLANI